jgi:dTMP kinase
VPGLFIVVEGPEGAGKSTLVRWLADRFQGEGRPVVTVREPGGTPVAEAARKVVLHFPQELAPAEELFLFLLARAHVVRTVIRPALEAGQVVLADRFELSTMAYQVAGGGLPYDEVARANRMATGGLVPDLTLVLDVPLAVGRERHARCRTGSSDRTMRSTGVCSKRTARPEVRAWCTSTPPSPRRPCRMLRGGKS